MCNTTILKAVKNMGIGKRIINLREARGWSQRELAKRVKLNPSVMNRIESEERPVKDQELLTFALVFGVSADELIGNPVEGKQTIYGREVDTGELTENQRTVLEWAMQQEALSFHSKEELSKILDNLALIMEYEKSKSKSNGNTNT